MIHQISIHVISIHGLYLKFIALSCQLTFCQPSFPASVPIPPEKQKTQWNLWLCSTYTLPKRGTYQRGLLPFFLETPTKMNGACLLIPKPESVEVEMIILYYFWGNLLLSLPPLGVTILLGINGRYSFGRHRNECFFFLSLGILAHFVR